MSAEEAEDWLGVAVGTVIDMPARILDQAALEARRTCTHHSQIVPTIVREAEALQARERSLAEARGSVTVIPETRRLAPPKLTDEELQFLPAPLKKLGLGAGWLTQSEDGTLSWTEQDTAA